MLETLKNRHKVECHLQIQISDVYKLKYMQIASSKHLQNMLCTQIVLFCF